MSPVFNGLEDLLMQDMYSRLYCIFNLFPLEEAQ
jgi:hypothetical protein